MNPQAAADATEDRPDKASKPVPEAEEPVDLRDLAQNIEEYELDYDDSLLTADEAYGGVRSRARLSLSMPAWPMYT